LAAIIDCGSCSFNPFDTDVAPSFSNKFFSVKAHETKTSTENILKETFKLNDSFKLTLNNDFNNSVSNQLSTENLAKCAQEAQANNSLDLSNIEVGGNANITDINQSNFVTAALDCAFNQDITNKLAAIFVTNYSNLIDNMLESTTTNNSGDILAAGTAGATMICAAGEAVSTGSQGLGSGVSTAAQGIGEGIGKAFGNPMVIVSSCFFIIILIAGVYFYMQQKKKNEEKNNNTDDSSTDA